MTPTLAIEALVALSRRFQHEPFRLWNRGAICAIHLKHEVWSSARAGVFATYGVAGSWTRVLTYDTMHPPVYLTIGGGVEREIARRTAVRVEAQTVMFGGFAPMGARMSAGMSFALSDYR